MLSCFVIQKFIFGVFILVTVAALSNQTDNKESKQTDDNQMKVRVKRQPYRPVHKAVMDSGDFYRLPGFPKRNEYKEIVHVTTARVRRKPPPRLLRASKNNRRTISSLKPVQRMKYTHKRKRPHRITSDATATGQRKRRTKMTSGPFNSQVVIVDGIEYPSIILGKLLIQNLTTTPIPTPAGMLDNVTFFREETKFSDFLQILFKFMVLKEPKHAKQIYLQAEKEFTIIHQLKRYDEFGTYVNDGFLHLFQLFNSIPAPAMRILSAKGYYMMSLRANGTLDREMNSILHQMDDIYAADRDVDDFILEVLNDVANYPHNTTKTAHEIVKNFFTRLIYNPLRKLVYTVQLENLKRTANGYIKKYWYPDTRRKDFRRKNSDSHRKRILQNNIGHKRSSPKHMATKPTLAPTSSPLQLNSSKVIKSMETHSISKVVPRKGFKTFNNKKQKVSSYNNIDKYNDFTDIEDEISINTNDYDDYSVEDLKTYKKVKTKTQITKNNRKTTALRTSKHKHTKEKKPFFSGIRRNVKNKVSNFRTHRHTVTKSLKTNSNIKGDYRKVRLDDSTESSDDELVLRRNLDNAFGHFNKKAAYNINRRLHNGTTIKHMKVASIHDRYNNKYKLNIDTSHQKTKSIKYVNEDIMITRDKKKNKKHVKSVGKPKALNEQSSYSDEEEVLKSNLNKAFVITPLGLT